MCGRYGFVESESTLRGDFPGLRLVDPIVAGYNLSPGRRLSVVLQQPDAPTLRSLTWGLRSERLKRPLTNVRVEGVSTHRLFGELLRAHRCVVPASFFIEWIDDSAPRQPFVATAAPARLGLAGLALDDTFAILTTQAKGPLASVHGRMPVLLPVAAFDPWLDATLTDPAGLRAAVKSFPAEDLDVYPIGTALNDARREGPALLVPLAGVSLHDRDRADRQ